MSCTHAACNEERAAIQKLGEAITVLESNGHECDVAWAWHDSLAAPYGDQLEGCAE